MECKSKYASAAPCPCTRINRYIMECKYLVYNYKHKEGCSELIDTLWNVNEKAENEYWVEDIELIDTLWNVNIKQPLSKLTESLELIDTLWNVNLSALSPC